MHTSCTCKDRCKPYRAHMRPSCYILAICVQRLFNTLACPALCLLQGHELDSLQLPGHRTSDICHARQGTVLSLGHRGGGWQPLKPYLRP